MIKIKLKVKFLKLSAGLPVVMVNKKIADKIGVHAHDRILIRTLKRRPKEVFSVVDVIEKIIKENEILVSSEIKKRLGLKIGQRVDVNFAPSPRSLKFIKNKLNKQILNLRQIKAIISDVVSNSLSEAEIALFVSAMYKNGMNFNEIVFLIKAILETGNKLRLRGKKIVDKHSIGGVAGNRTTPIVVAICAAAGLVMPKNSSRAITSAAGTADVIETVARVDFSISELKKIIKKTNACLIWGGGLGIVPADSKIIRIEKILKIDPEAQLLASIMSKKLAMGSNHILIDIPYGKGAKVGRAKALNLKKKFEKLGKIIQRKIIKLEQEKKCNML